MKDSKEIIVPESSVMNTKQSSIKESQRNKSRKA